MFYFRFLATGDSQQTISFNFRVGNATVCNIIQETCEALCQVLKPNDLKPPSSADEWREIAAGFETEWNFPHCFGAVDGKHVVMQAPALSGSEFFNYKGQFSIVQQQSDGSLLSNLADREVNGGELLPGSWRRETPGTNLTRIGQMSSNNYDRQAPVVRDEFKQFFNSKNGSLEWQFRVVHRR